MSSAVIFASSNAFTAASYAISALVSLSAKYLERIPVLDTIHWSLVSTIFSISEFVTILSPGKLPVPIILIPATYPISAFLLLFIFPMFLNFLYLFSAIL